MHRHHTIYGVLVTFHPEEGWHQRLKDILSQVGHLVVVDNSQSDEACQQVKAVCDAYKEQITYLQSPQNNLAMAQNIGIRYVLAAGASHVLLLDDDSQPQPGMVAAMLAYDTPSIGLLAPVMADEGSRRSTRYLIAKGMRIRLAAIGAGKTGDDVMHVIASGSLIARRSFEQAGMMDESFGIDYVDKDFCLRLRQAGLGIRVVGDARLRHRIGSSRDHRLAGLRITATNHCAQRRYTIYRNRIWCLRRYSLKEAAFFLHEMTGIAYDWLRIAAFEDNKKEKFRAILRGIKDGLSTPC